MLIEQYDAYEVLPGVNLNGTVANIPAIYAAFDLQESDELYRAPEQRVSIW